MKTLIKNYLWHNNIGIASFADQKICRETRTTIHSVAGPNGALSVHGVAQCNCERACYRQHFNIAVTELAVAPNGNSVERTKVLKYFNFSINSVSLYFLKLTSSSFRSLSMLANALDLVDL